MTKKIFFVLILAIAGIVSVNAQMRIGGSEVPNRSAVLDLNPDDKVSAGNATLGLALPRVNLRNCDDAFPLPSHVKGMTVYNLAAEGDVKPGVYVNNGAKWLRQADSEWDFAVLGDSIVNYITQNFSTTALGDSISNYITQNFETLNFGDTIMQFITNNLDSSALMDSVANYISSNNAYLTQLIDNIAKNVYQTTLGDSIVNYISNQITNTLLGDSILQYITDNITNTVLGDSIINLVHENELDGVVGNEVTNATSDGGLIRSGAGTNLSPYTLGVAQEGVTTDKLADKSVTFNKLADNTVIELGDNLAANVYNTVLGDSIISYITQNFTTTSLGDSISYYITQNFESLNLGDTIMQFITNNLDNSSLMDSVANYISNNNSYLTQLIDNIAQNVYQTTLGDSIVNYISNQISNTLLGDTILQYITDNITNTVLGDSIINLVHENELDGVVGNEITNATANGGLVRSGAGTAISPYTLGIANSGVTTAHLANNAVNSSKITDGTVATADLADNAVTAAKIADGTITNADINASAGIALSKIALPDATANNGKVLKSNGAAWVAGDDNNTVSNTAYTAGSGLTLSGTTFSIGASQVNGTMIADGAVSTADIADNAVTSAKIANGTITAADLSSMNATNGEVLKWNGTTWSPAADFGLTAEIDGIIGNEVSNATANGGLTRSGAGTAASPYTLGITSGGVTSSHIADNAITSSKIADNAVTSSKIADNSITNTDISSSAAIALNKLALPDAVANNGKVLKSNGTTWVAAADNDTNTDTNTTYSAGSGLTLSGTTFGIGAGQVNGTMLADNAVTTAKIADGTVSTTDIADNAVTSAKIANGTIASADLSQMGATSGQVLKWSGTAWSPAADSGLTAETDGIIGNEVTNATSSGGLTRSGAGTTASPYTLGIANSGVTNSFIADNAVTTTKIANKSIINEDIANSAIKPNLLDIDGDKGFVWFNREDANNMFVDIEQMSTTHIANSAVTSAKIADGTITDADINTSAGITLNKLSAANTTVGNTSAAHGAVMTWDTGGWQPKMPTASGISSVSGSNGISVANGTTTPVVSIADNGVTSAKIQNGTVKAEDLNSMGASNGDVLTYSGSSWLPQPLNLDGAVVYLGTNDETYSPIPGGTYSAGQILSIFIKVDVPTGYSYYIFVPSSSANAMFPAFASTFGSGTHSRHIIFTRSTSYSSFNVKYLIFGIK